MRLKGTLIVVMLLAMAGSATAATFVVPTDDELVLKAHAIVTGTVEGSFVQETGGTIETVYEIRLERGFKGVLRKGELVRVVTLGGVVGDRGVLVPGEARYEQGEQVLVFLDRDERGRWRTTDLTLGRFEFVTSTKGERLLVRAMEDVVGWDHAGNPHREKVRREAGFLQFIAARAGNRQAPADYMIEASEVTLGPEPVDGFTASSHSHSFPPGTYTDFVNNQPIRWPNMANGVGFYKRSDQNISGAADGGVSVIQGGLAAWTNEAQSNINLSYIGQLAKASQNHDATNVVEFNDPQSRISGSWTGSGTVGICFLSFSGTHSFSGQTWLNITDADVVIQNGFPATNASFASAMTHELGHGIGWRHSNQNHATGGACNSAVEECTSAAIMNSSVSANYGYNLQAWDRNASHAVYPGSAPTCTAPAITAQPTSRTIDQGQQTVISVTATGTGPLSYQWYFGASGNTSSPVPGGTGTSVITVAPSTTTSYWVRVSNSCGTVDSVSATVTVNASCTAPAITAQPTSRTINQGQQTVLSVTATGTGPLSYQWYFGASGNTSSPVPGGAGTSVITVAPSTTTSYWVRVSNSCGAVNSVSATVTVVASCAAPAITAQPTSRTINQGQQTVISVTATGTGPLSYQWYFGASGNTSSPVPGGAGTSVITVAPSSTTSYWVRVSNGCGAVNSVAATVTVNSAPVAHAAIARDFNGDGRADILWRNPTTGENGIWPMGGTNGTQRIGPDIGLARLAPPWQIFGAADFNQNGHTDIVWRNTSTGGVMIWLMNRSTVAQTVNLAPVTDLNWTIAGTGDFNSDDFGDLLWRNTATGANEIWLMNGTTIASKVAIPTVPTNWILVGSGQFNRAGATDILWRNTAATGEIEVWLMNGTAIATKVALPSSTDQRWQMLAIGDYNGDGSDDIVWRNNPTLQNGLWLMEGTTRIGNLAVPPGTSAAWTIVGPR